MKKRGMNSRTFLVLTKEQRSKICSTTIFPACGAFWSSVQKANVASTMYLKMGFQVFKETEEEYVMVRDLQDFNKVVIYENY